MAYLNLRSGKLYYEAQGDGQPIVIIRGTLFSSRYWLGFDKKLAQSFKVITFDNRGTGRSNTPAGWGMSISDLASDAAALLDHLKIPKAHFLGVSLGGMASLAFAIKHPERCASVIAVNTSIAGTGSFRLTIPATIALLRNGHRRDRLLRALARLLVEERNYEKVLKKWQAITTKEELPVVTSIKQLAAAARFFAAKELTNLKAPALIVYGANDRFVPVGNSFTLHRLIPGAELCKIENAGHELMLDQPERLLDLVKEFTGKHSLQKAKLAARPANIALTVVEN